MSVVYRCSSCSIWARKKGVRCPKHRLPLVPHVVVLNKALRAATQGRELR